jgi:predicted TIM-barrel fold metal-dependent hydrolase
MVSPVYADELLRPWADSILEQLPGARLFDVHTHTGQNDPDGFRAAAEDLVAALEMVDGRASVFTMHEPDGYSAANDRVLAEAAASGGRLVPFCRVDPYSDGAGEAARCLDAGARGIKLHPRAERFALRGPEVEAIFAVADERRAPVIVHAGRGIPALGRDALELASRFEGARIILAHAGVCDLGWIWRHAADHPNLFFDTAWWSASDLLTLFAFVPPGQILYGSDAPYGTPLEASINALRCALQAGLTAEQAAAVAGGQAERLVAWEEPLRLGPAPGPRRLATDLLLDRVHTYLVTGIARMLVGQRPDEYLALAALACEVGDDTPQAPVCRSVLALLKLRERYAAEAREGGALEAGWRSAVQAPGIHLVVAAGMVSRTPDVPLPPEPEAVDVGERER